MRVFHQQEREKRRRRVLVEQMKAHEAQEVIANTCSYCVVMTVLYVILYNVHISLDSHVIL